MKNLLLILTFLILRISCLGQGNPPPMAMPDDSNTLLINKIIEVTKHEKYFVDYCTLKVKEYAAKNNWSTGKTNEILESIKFKYYKTTIYNSYAFYSREQLRKTLEALTALNETNKNLPMVLTNSMMQSNLDLFVESLIEGKYISRKK